MGSEPRDFRDLYYRLNVFPIVLPPLRERPEDVPALDDALRECGSITRAAERLGLARQSLQQMLRRRQA